MSKPYYSPDFSRQMGDILSRLKGLELANYQEAVDEDNSVEWKYVGPGAAATFNSPWTNFDGMAFNPTDRSARYCIDEHGFVHIEGVIKSGASGVTAFTLPVGFRPLASKAFVSRNSGGVASIGVNNDGTVTPSDITGASTTFVFLDGITFSTT